MSINKTDFESRVVLFEKESFMGMKVQSRWLGYRAAPGPVKVICGANDDVFDVAGNTVAAVQARLADAFNIPIQAFAYVNGIVVPEDFRLRSNDCLEFIVLWGTKSGSDKRDDAAFLKQPFPYFGGKSRVAPEVWRRFGDINNYVEPFFGGGAVLLNRQVLAPNQIETVNDLDGLLVNFWRAAKLHPRKLAAVADYPVSELDLHARHVWLSQNKNAIYEKMIAQPAWCDPEVAAWWVWGISQWSGSGWCGRATQSRQKPHPDRRGIQRLSHQRGDGPVTENDGRGSLLQDYFDLLSRRLERVRIHVGDWSRVVTPSLTTRNGLSGVFLDPPYTKESERQLDLYASDDHAIGHEVQEWAVENGGDPRFRIALCGYDGEYDMPSSWSVYEWKAVGSRTGNKERIWFSPHCLP